MSASTLTPVEPLVGLAGFREVEAGDDEELFAKHCLDTFELQC